MRNRKCQDISRAPVSGIEGIHTPVFFRHRRFSRHVRFIRSCRSLQEACWDSLRKDKLKHARSSAIGQNVHVCRRNGDTLDFPFSCWSSTRLSVTCFCSHGLAVSMSRTVSGSSAAAVTELREAPQPCWRLTHRLKHFVPRNSKQTPH